MVEAKQHPAMYYERLDRQRVGCFLCPHNCNIPSGHTGICGVRYNHDGTLIAESYGRITALALDPIEKKPLSRFHPGSYIHSAGSYGCNLKCSFCQNHSISMERTREDRKDPFLTGRRRWVYIPPENLVEKALDLVSEGNIGIAYTYNEPLISYEYVYDCSRLAHEKGLKNALVTNGYISREPFLELLPYIDAINIDLKSFRDEFYTKICGGSPQYVKNTIEAAAESCHVEVTTLIIPGLNNSPDEMKELAAWLASINPEIPLHLSRFFPNYRMLDRPPTPPQTIYSLVSVAREYLKYVYTGNL
jgi:pyruvate formate lyase activating enzyme